MLRGDASGARADEFEGIDPPLSKTFDSVGGWPEQDEIELMLTVGCVRSDRIRVTEAVNFS